MADLIPFVNDAVQDAVEELAQRLGENPVVEYLLDPFGRRRRAREAARIRNRNRVIATVALGLVGAGALAWWYQTRLAHAGQRVAVADRRVLPPPSLPDDLPNKGDLQLLADGYGPLYFRRYYADIKAPGKSAADLMGQIKRDVNTFTPQELAHFKKIKGGEDDLRLGDEFYIRITGPWDAWVRTVAVTDTSFSFVTLRGHLEAGEIHFEILPSPEHEGEFRFQIQSWSRSRDFIVYVFYTILGLVQLFQTSIWVAFCKRAVEHSGGEAVGEVKVFTASAPYEPPKPINPAAPAAAWKRYERNFGRYQTTALNFDLEQRENFTEANGWRIDDYAVELPNEPPGQPFPGGAWEKAVEVLQNYEFPDPAIITGIFMPDVPLQDRIMVLRARFLFFTFLFGVKIGDLIDDERDDANKGRARVWGYSYRTLQGHFEAGEITFTIWKFLDSGQVEFRVHAYSKVTFIPNPFYRIGFELFGRGLQVRFARTALERMREFVVRRTAGVNYTTDQPLETVDVQPAGADPAAAEKLEQTADQIEDARTEAADEARVELGVGQGDVVPSTR